MNDRAIAVAILDKRKREHVPGFNLKDICFPEQLAFIEDKSPWVTASCSRRAGKTEVCAFDLIHTALAQENVTCLYITLTRANAERLVWPKLLMVNEKYKLQGVVNISKLSITFPNGSIIYCSGCNDKSELDKFRGLALRLIYIDEAQSFKSFIRELIDEVLAPTLADYAGSLKLLGTPAPIKTGFFWETKQSEAYSHHQWTFWNNPFIASKSGLSHAEILERELKRRGVSKDHPSVRREWFGEWTIDTDSLVLHYQDDKNHYEGIPELTDYLIAIDVGFNDADAIAVIGWHKHHRVAYLVEELVTPQQGITELINQLQPLVKKYDPFKVIMDPGGGGKKIAEEITKRHDITVLPAEKSRKIEYLALLDDALRTGNFKAKKSSRFAEDSFTVEWDYDKSTSDKLVIKDEPHSDIVDAVLYGFREALHWLSEPEVVRPKPGTNAYAQMQEDEVIERLEKELFDQKEEELMKNQDFLFDY